jgi:hypothetical protein
LVLFRASWSIFSFSLSDFCMSFSSSATAPNCEEKALSATTMFTL